MSNVSASKGIARVGGITASSAEQLSVGAKVFQENYKYSSQKGLPWSAEENCLLVQLREEESLAWSGVIQRFDQRFPRRSKGPIQVYWSTTLKKQQPS